MKEQPEGEIGEVGSGESGEALSGSRVKYVSRREQGESSGLSVKLVEDVEMLRCCEVLLMVGAGVTVMVRGEGIVRLV